MAKAALHKKKTFHQHIGFKFKENTSTTIAAMACTVLEKITQNDRVQNAVSLEVGEDRNILHTIKRRKYIWIGHMLRRNCI
jgi:ribosomal 50S subunit-associated protein YjgA (DUF615 family)